MDFHVAHRAPEDCAVEGNNVAAEAAETGGMKFRGSFDVRRHNVGRGADGVAAHEKRAARRVRDEGGAVAKGEIVEVGEEQEFWIVGQALR